MQITNFNFYTVFVFLILSGILGYMMYKKITFQIFLNEKYKKIASGKYFYVKYLFLFLSFFVALVSIFGIKYGEKITNNESKGIDILFTLDVSKSMNVADFKDENYYYTRLDIVKKAISEFVSHHSENRYGLVIFSGEAVSTVPLTDDNDLFLTFLQGVDYKNLVKQGSDFTTALTLSTQRFTDKNRSKAIIFISDGGDREDVIQSKTLQKISQKDSSIHYSVVGVGTSQGGKIIQGQDVFGRYIYQTYNNQEVISQINIPNLKEIASAIGGDFIQLKELSDIEKLNTSLNTLQKSVLKKGSSGELGDFSRILGMVSCFFFMIFLGFYFFNNRLGKKF